MSETSICERLLQRRVEAADEFNRRTQRSDGLAVAISLAEGLNLLRDAFFIRIYKDVERVRGSDSMLAPISPAASETRTKTEIEVFLVVESAAAIHGMDWVQDGDTWYLPWLARLRLGVDPQAESGASRFAGYSHREANERRLAFAELLERALPEARYAPLVMYRLLPLAVGVATALAYRDHLYANELRNRQMGLLPAIGDCLTCHGHSLENGELCKKCGNPWWKVEWLTSDG